MHLRPNYFRLGVLCSLALVAVGCGSSGGGGSSQLAVVSFPPAGTDGAVFRDEPIEFTFSAPIDAESVSISALQVTQGGEVVQGRIEIQRNRIRWYPVVLPGDRNDYFPPNNPPINGLGFEGNARYTVKMIGNSPFSIRSRQGRPLARDFQASFITSTEFLPEDPPVRPRLLGGPHFDPAPIVDGDPFSPDPADWPVFDPTEVRIRLVMSERIAPASLHPFESIFVRNVTDVPEPAPAGVGEIALMDVALSPAADEIVLENIVSLGDWPNTDLPYEFEVTLGEGLTDLAGNAFDGPVVFHFLTADKPEEPNYRVVTETFDTVDNLDENETSAEWGGGRLEGADVNSRLIEFVPTPQSRFNLPHPLVEAGNMTTPNGCRFQMKWDTTHINAIPGESITSMSWQPRSNFAFFSSYRDVTMKLGHFPGGNGAHLGIQFDVNIIPPATTVFQGDYQVPFGLDVDWVEWPTFRTDFEYDGEHPLVMEWDMPEGGDTFQLFENKSNGNFQTHRIYANGGESRRRTPPENTQYNTRFVMVSKKSIGQSIPIDTEIGGADFDGFLVFTDTERPGTRVRTLWGGSLNGLPPQSFAEQIDIADFATHIVFRIELTANPFTAILPRVFSVSYAFVVPDDL